MQRGLGAAALRVLDGDVGDAAPMVLDCIARDPRWDRQLDSRSDYYAWLVPVAGIEVSALVELVRSSEPAPGDIDAGPSLALEVLLRLAEQGSAPAVEASHAYAACRCAPTVEALGERAGGQGLAPARERIRGRPTDELLAIRDISYLQQVGQKLDRRTTKADESAMLATIEDPHAPMRPAAARALARRGRVEALPAALELDESTQPRVVRAMLKQAFEALPYEHTRDTALAWLDSPDGARRRAAESALAAHAVADDVVLVRALLDAELDAGLEGDQYRVCDLATALGRHPGLGPYPELHRAFREMPYSYGRRFVVEALAATDPSFPTTLAAECARDAEPEIRAIARRRAP